jgi:5,10-methylenetetrahydrofolate reductase
MRIKEKLLSGEFVLLAEMEPPKGVDVSEMLANAVQVKGKVDAFMVPEMSNAVMRISSLGGCMLLQGKGLDTVMQICCRDRNRLALQADLLAANVLGISVVIAIKGEEPSFGDHPRARAVHDVDLLELLEGVKKLQAGRDMAGVELKGSPSFCVGSVVNVGVSGGALDIEIEAMEKKIEAGVEFFITPSVFDLQSLGKFMKRAAVHKPRIIPRVTLLKSAGMARYIQRYFENVHIPEEVIRRIEQAPDRIRECVRIAAEQVSAIKEAGYSGVLISTIGWEDKLPGILGE